MYKRQGYDTHMGNSLVPAVDLIKELLARSPLEQALAGELLLVIVMPAWAPIMTHRQPHAAGSGVMLQRH